VDPHRPFPFASTLFALCLAASASACHANDESGPLGEGVSCPAYFYIAGDACVPWPAFSDAALVLERDATLATDAGVGDSATALDGPQDAAPRADAEAGTFDLVCEAGEPVPECVEYFELLSACTGSDYAAAACQTATDTDASDRASIAQLCIINIQRIQQACQ
jgi:hypothetical protein